LFIVGVLAIGGSVQAAGGPPPLPGERKTDVLSPVEAPALFASSAGTLDPKEIARICWKGYLTEQPDEWGMLPDGQPSYRFHFDSRALPWPVLKHHSVDGFDNNNRNLGAHARLHLLFGGEKDNDPAEAGQVAYLLSLTDPQTGIPFDPGGVAKSCAIGHGELAGNVMMMYQATGDPMYRDWAAKTITAFQKYAVLTNWPNVGPVAYYLQGMFNPADAPATQTQDPTMGGWEFLAVGWNLGAFAKWYEITGDTNSLNFAVALGNRLFHSADASGNDGSFRPDGSFGGQSQASTASWHMHGHTHCLPRVLSLGTQLERAGRPEVAYQMISETGRCFDWLYDPTRNPDAGSLTGWLPEWLIVATGWNRKSDCEGCTMGDVVETATALGAASRLDPRLADYVKYYDRAEQIFTGELAEQMFRPKPRYLAVVKEDLRHRIERDLPEATAEARSQELDRRYAAAIVTATRMTGQQMGLCGFPDWVNNQISDIDSNYPGIHMQGCCADATIRAAYAVWDQTVTGDPAETRVNLAFNRHSDLVEVVSCLPHRGELDVTVKKSKRVLVRTPGWVTKPEVKAYRNKNEVATKWDGTYVEFPETRPGDLLTVTYPLRVTEIAETIQGTHYVEKWRGNTIVEINPPGKWIPMFERPELESLDVPPPGEVRIEARLSHEENLLR
jgi:hypothetical protein